MPKATPIVHIGFPKTASTWFQKSFYPHVRSPRYIDRTRVNAVFLDGNALSFDPVEGRRTLGLADAEAGILCEEGLCGYLHNGGVDGAVSKEVAARIKATLPDARIVIFVRAQPKIIVAAYQQYVRSGGTYSVRRYLFPKDYLIGPNAVSYKQPRFDIAFFRYAALVELYERLFGRGRVHVFLFEELQKGGLDFMRRYADQLKLDVDWANVSLAPRLSSYGLPLTWLARFFNLFTARSVLDKGHLLHIPGWYPLRRLILESLNRTRLFGRPPTPERLLGRQLLHWLEAYYAEDNRRLAADRRGLPLDRHGYPLDPADPGERPKPGKWRRHLAW